MLCDIAFCRVAEIQISPVRRAILLQTMPTVLCHRAERYEDNILTLVPKLFTSGKKGREMGGFSRLARPAAPARTGRTRSAGGQSIPAALHELTFIAKT
jgi:hypothetical protein